MKGEFAHEGLRASRKGKKGRAERPPGGWRFLLNAASRVSTENRSVRRYLQRTVEPHLKRRAFIEPEVAVGEQSG